jgi:hypothetical protein
MEDQLWQKHKEYLVGTSVHQPSEAGKSWTSKPDPGEDQIRFATANFTRGTEDEFGASMPGYEAKAAELARWGDLFAQRRAALHVARTNANRN